MTVHFGGVNEKVSLIYKQREDATCYAFQFYTFTYPYYSNLAIITTAFLLYKLYTIVGEV